MSATELQRLAGEARAACAEAHPGSAGNAQTWQREMERAQVESWLRHGVIPSHAEGGAAASQSPSKVVVAATVAPQALQAPNVAASSRPPDSLGDAGTSPMQHQSLLAADRTMPSSAEQRPLRSGDASADAVRSGAPHDRAPATAVLTTMLEQCVVSTWGVTATTPTTMSARAVTAPSAGQDAVAPATSQPREAMAMLPQSFAVLTPEPAAGRVSDRLVASPPEAVKRSERQKPSPDEPVRIHCQWTAQGLGLWLGVDAARSFDLVALTREIRTMLARQSLRLASVVCNGELVFGAEMAADHQERLPASDTPTKEGIWPSTQ